MKPKGQHHEIHEVLADSQQRYARMIASVESYVLAVTPM